MANLKNVVYCSESQYDNLIAGQTVSGHTYDADNLYAVPFSISKDSIAVQPGDLTPITAPAIVCISAITNGVAYNGIIFCSGTNSNYPQVQSITTADGTGFNTIYEGGELQIVPLTLVALTSSRLRK